MKQVAPGSDFTALTLMLKLQLLALPSHGSATPPRAASFAVDLEGVIREWSGEAEEVFGFTRAEATDRSVMLIIPLEHAEAEAEMLGAIARGKHVVRHHVERRQENGATVVGKLRAAPIFEGPAVVGASLSFLPA